MQVAEVCFYGLARDEAGIDVLAYGELAWEWEGEREGEREGQT